MEADEGAKEIPFRVLETIGHLSGEQPRSTECRQETAGTRCPLTQGWRWWRARDHSTRLESLTLESLTLESLTPEPEHTVPRPLHLSIHLLIAVVTSSLMADDQRHHELPGPPAAGPGSIPYHQGPASLQAIGELAEIDPTLAADQFRQWIETRRGSLVISSTPPNVGTRGTIRIEPPHLQLARWARRIPASFLELALQRLGPIPIDCVHPLLWHPGLEMEASQALQEAVERADRSSAAALLRRPGLASILDPKILEWLQTDAPPRSPWQRVDGPIGSLPPAGWEQRFSPSRPAPPSQQFVAPPISASMTLRQRRAASYPLLSGTMALVSNDQQVLAIDLDDPRQEVWRWTSLPELEYKGTPGKIAPFPSVPWIPVSSGPRCLFLMPTPSKKVRPTSNVFLALGGWKDRGWLEATLLEIPDPSSPPTDSWVVPFIEEGFTACPTPLLHGDHLWLMATRGWNQLEVWLFAYDVSSKKELWRRQLAEETAEAHSMNDLRDKILHSALAVDGDNLLLCRSGGAIDCLSASTGEHIASLYQPRWRLEDLSPLSTAKFGPSRFHSFPAQVPRTLTPLQQPQDDKTPWVMLPADGRLVVALDQERWTVRWSYPVARAASYLGIVDGHAWIIDATAEDRQGTVEVVGLDPRRGTVTSGPWRIPLYIPPASSEENSLDASDSTATPRLHGSPRVLPGRMWIPTRLGLQIHSLVDGSMLGWVDWPSDTAGGTATPYLEGDLIVTQSAPFVTAKDGTTQVKTLIERIDAGERDEEDAGSGRN